MQLYHCTSIYQIMMKNNFFTQSIKHYLVVAILFVATFSGAQTKLADWTVSGGGFTAAPTFTNGFAHATAVSSISISHNGYSAGPFQDQSYFVHHTNTASTLNTSTAPYTQFTVNLNTSSITFDKILVKFASAGAKLQLRWSVDGYASSLGEKTDADLIVDSYLFNLSTLSAVTANTVTFRLYSYAGSSNPSNLQFSDNHGSNPENITTTYLTGAKAINIFYSAATVVSSPPTITSFTPSSGAVGTSVTITGTNFNTTAANNVVYFGGVKASVTSATATQLVVTVPAGGSGKVSATNTSSFLTAYSGKYFSITYANGGHDINSCAFPLTNTITTISPTVRIGTAWHDSRFNPTGSGDFNGDGKIDLVKVDGNTTVKGFDVYVNTSSGTGNFNFAVGIQVTSTRALSSLLVADFDNDGKLDVAATDGSTYEIYKNTTSSSSVTFAAPIVVSAGSSLRNMMGDINGDGKMDIVYSTNYGSVISLLLNTSSAGNLSFNGAVNYIGAMGGNRGLGVGDFNNDFKTDVVTGDEWNNGANNGGTIQLSTSSATVATPTKVDVTSLIGCCFEGVVEAIDLNGDGKDDLIKRGSDALKISQNNWSSGVMTSADFSSVINKSLSGYTSNHLDMNGDGKIDLVGFNILGNGIYSIKNNVGTTITAADLVNQTIDASVASPWGGFLGDFDLDGRNDVISLTPGSVNSTIQIYKNSPLPLITTTGTINAFVACAGTASTPQTISVTGDFMTSAITLTAPTNFEISLASGSGYAASLTLNPTSGSVSATTIYIRTKSTATGTLSGNLTLAATCATTQSIALSGVVNAVTAISAHPSTAVVSICQNGTLSALSVTSSGSSLTYQWYSNTTASTTGASAITGATNSTYAPSNSTPSAFYYYCVVTGTCGTVTSNISGLITVSITPVAGTASATSTALCVGNTTDLSITGSTGNIQWQSSPNNTTWTNIVGATAASYTTPALSTTTFYRAVVSSGSCTSVNSNVLTITISTNQPFGNALALNGSGKIQFGNQTAAAVSTNFTIEAWVNVPTSAFSIQTILSNSPVPSSLSGFKLGINSWQTYDGKIILEGSNSFLSSTGAIAKNVWQHVAVVVNGTSVTFYINGVEAGSATGSFTATSSYPLTIGDFSGGSYPFNGSMDEVRLWNVSKSKQAIQAAIYGPLTGSESGLAAYFNFNQGIPGGTNTGITNLNDNGPYSFTGSLSEITRTGTAENFVANTNAMAIIGSTACVGSTVQLYHPQSGGSWSSATTSVATINSSGLATCLTAGTSVISYTYTYNSCQFTDTYTMTVNATPVAPTVATTTFAYCQNASAPALTATAAANHTLRWYTVATGGTGSTTAITPVTSTAGTFTYYVAQANASGCDGPRVAITVTVSPTSVAGTVAAAATSICSGGTTTLSLTGNTGTVQWQSSPNNSTWTNISGATSTSYTTPALTSTTFYKAVVTSGSCASVNSNIVTISTIATSAVSQITGNSALCVGSTTTLSNTQAGGTWSSTTTAVASINASGVVNTLSAGTSVVSYTIIDGNNCPASATITLTVADIPAAPSTLSATPTAACVGATVNLNATTNASGINWYTDSTGGTLVGSSLSTQNLSITAASNTPRYYAESYTTIVVGSQTINYSGAITTFTVPSGVTNLKIDTRGASGGNSGAKTGGNGARMVGDFTVTPGQVLKVLVGGTGSTGTWAAGGGGGTFVTDINNNPLCIAGGGGGAQSSAGLNGNPGLTSTSGGGTNGGTNGNGGGQQYASGGGGLLTNGTSSGNGGPGLSFLNGGAGGASCGSAGAGGFGGGSGGEWCYVGSAGAGGGYSGGGGNSGAGNGGGSFNNGANQTNTQGFNSGNGSVVFSWNVGSCPSTSRSQLPITVNAIPVITGAQNMTVGGATLQLSATETPDATMPWASSNTAVATVSSTGVVTAVGAGSTTITYTTSGGCTTTAAIQVIDCTQPLGNALAFGNGSVAANADFVQVNSRIFPSQTVANFTIETWIRPSAADLGANNFYGFLGSNGRNPSLYICDGGKIHVSYVETTGTGFITPNALLTQDKWHHVALVKSGTTITLFVNGVQAFTQACAANFALNDNYYWLGKIDNQFNGALDEVRFWSTARTQAQIQATMNTELTGTETGLLTYFDFNQGVGGGTNTSITSVTNKANSALNGAMNSFTKTGTSSNFVGSTIANFDITGPATICANTTAQYTHFISGGTWSVSNGATATVSNSGLVTSSTNENVTLSYTYTVNGCSITATKAITINSPATPVATTSINYCQGATASALSATVVTGNTLQWYTVATGGTASLTAPTPSIVSLGVTTYYVSQKNNTTTCESPRTAITVTVNAVPTISGAQSMTVGGGTLQLTGSGTPDATIPWSSSNTAVATISSTGEVTAVAGGASVITYTTTSGCSITATIKVTDCAAPFGNALNFDGVNDYAVVDNVGNNANLSFSGTSNFTIESWVKRENTNGIAMIFSKYNGGVAGNYWLGIDNTGKPNFSREASPWGVTATNALPVNEWHHIAATYDGAQTKIYVDGVLSNTTSAPLSINQNVSNIKVNIGAGLSNNSPAHFFKGELDEIRVWNVARTATQIQQNFNTTLQGNETGLAAYYDFNQGIAGGNNTTVNAVVNAVNSASNGTLTNLAKNGTSSNFVGSTIANFPINGAASICAYSSAQFTHQISGGTWSLASGAAATISTSGLITSSVNESVTINYTYTMNGCSVTATKTVTVENPVISGLATVAAGEQITLTATTTPATNNAWVSTNTSKLSVTSAGVVTGLAPGTASVIYTNNLGCKDTLVVTVTVGTTVAPTLTSPATNTTGATTLNIVYSLPEAPFAGSVTLTFTPVGGGTPIVWTMNNATSANFNYVVGTNPISSTVTAGAALGFTTYNVTLAYQDAYANPAATVTNTNIQTLAPPIISFNNTSFATVVNSTLTINTINTGGSMVTYSIAPTLPTGFTFNTTTGVITGSSTVAISATTFTVTATNAAGTDTEPFSLAITADTDGDGIPDIADADVNGDGVIDNGPDTDGDGIIDQYDNDIDGDGIPNNLDNDADGDGVPNAQDVCSLIPNTAITVQPSTTSQVICPSASIGALTVTATGPGLSYQWYRNTTASTTGGTLLVGATNASYIPLNTVSGTVYYYVIVSGTCGNATSNVSGSILVTDVTLPTVLTQNRTIYLNTSGQATITAAQIDNGSTDNCAIATRTLSQTTFNCNNVGVNTVTLTVTDASGNIRTGNATVTVIDSIKPTVVTQNITVNLNASGQASITAAQINNGSSDNCGIASVILNQTAFTCAHTGPNTVTLSVTDVNGNVKTKTAIVTVVDNILPTVVTQNVIRYLNASGQAIVSANDINNGSTDNCGIGTVALSQTAFTCAHVGVNTVTLTVTDTKGNSATGQATVTIIDNTPPTAIAQNINAYLNAGGAVTVTPSQVGGGSTDNCSIATMTLNNTTFNCSNLGANPVILTVVDPFNNVSTANAVITVVDSIKPLLTIPADITVNANSGCGAFGFPIGTASATDNCSVISAITNNAPSFYPVGITNIVYSVTDGSGNTKTKIQKVTVIDNVIPIITAPAAIATTLTTGCTKSGVNLGTPVTSDNCTIASVTNNAPTAFPVGTTTVTWTVIDASGNTATATQTVTVTDAINPTISAPANLTINANASCVAFGVALGTPVTADNCTVASITNNAPAVFPIGTTIVTWKVIDASGNFATSNQTVNVVDNAAPLIFAPAAITLAITSGCTVANLALGTPVTMDNCSTLTVTNNAPTTFPIGITSVTWTATDGAGNTATATQVVTIVDNTDPTITAPAAVTANLTTGCTATGIALGTPVTADNCSVASVTNNAPSVFPLGTTTITWTVTDGSGRTATATQTVTVVDNTNPTITAPAAISVTTNAGCTATGIVLGTPVTADNCTVASITNNAPAVFPIGTTIVTWKVIDASGNFATSNQTVNVVDNAAPLIFAPAAITLAITSGCTVANLALGTPVTMDNCSTLTVTNNAPTTFPIGITSVTWTATDGAGNTATATQVVTIVDNTDPTITAPAAVTANLTTGCTATGIALGTPTTADNCTVASVTNNAPVTYPIGTTLVTWTVTDGAGNTATTAQLVTITDNTNPTITAPAAISATTNAGCTATGIVLGTPVTADNCTVASVTNNAPTVFPIGTTTITWVVTDGAGNATTATQLVTITDAINPTITAPSNITVNTNSGCTATGIALGSPITADNCSVVSVTNNAPTTFPIGTTTVSWVVTDGAGNTASTTQTVTVNDVQLPTITPPANVTQYVSSGCTVNGIVIGTPVTADNCTVSSVTNDAPGTFPIGTTTVTWIVTDGAGNTASATQLVTVIDTIAPVAQLIDATIALNANGTATLNYAAVNNGSYDNCGIATVELSQSLFSCDDLGTQTVIVTLTDSYGNSTSQLIKVTVINSGIDIDLDGIDDACDDFVNTQIVQVPSGFSPNGDNINDTFIIPALDQFSSVHLQVYNKYGHEVYVSAQYNNDWNGSSSFNGMELPDDTYFYILTTDGEVRQGFVYINRVK